jgi:cellulose 1,4-beta-cellobiosidase
MNRCHRPLLVALASLALSVAASLSACFAPTALCADVASQCGSAPADSGAMGDADVSDAKANSDAWSPSDGGVTTCATYENVTVGSYIVQTNYWNETGCPGTQCMTIDDVTGAFSVTQGPDCGSTVASYPNVLYGSSFGVVSPGSALPMQVSALTSATSSWSFSVGGVSTDRYDVAYDIWFCPDTTCGASGFNGGTEMMIWLDYQNTTGWGSNLGSVTLSGYDWEVWKATQDLSGSTWNYLAYLIRPPMQTSVTDLDLVSFIQDAESRSYVNNSWYLYAIQAGDELRTGGLPFTTNSFSVSINGS